MDLFLRMTSFFSLVFVLAQAPSAGAASKSNCAGHFAERNLVSLEIDNAIIQSARMTTPGDLDIGSRRLSIGGIPVELPDDLLPSASLALLHGLSADQRLERSQVQGKDSMVKITTGDFNPKSPNSEYSSKPPAGYSVPEGFEVQLGFGAFVDDFTNEFPMFSRLFVSLNGTRHHLNSREFPLLLLAYSARVPLLFKRFTDGDAALVRGGCLNADTFHRDRYVEATRASGRLVAVEHEETGFSIYVEESQNAGHLKKRIRVESGKQAQFILFMLAMIKGFPVDLEIERTPVAKGVTDTSFKNLLIGEWDSKDSDAKPRSSIHLDGTTSSPEDTIRVVGADISRHQAQLFFRGKTAKVYLDSIWESITLLTLAKP